MVHKGCTSIDGMCLWNVALLLGKLFLEQRQIMSAMALRLMDDLMLAHCLFIRMSVLIMTCVLH